MAVRILSELRRSIKGETSADFRQRTERFPRSETSRGVFTRVHDVFSIHRRDQNVDSIRQALSVSLLTSQTEVSLDNPTLSLDSHLEQLVCVEDVHSTGDESEVVAASRNCELPDEDA